MFQKIKQVWVNYFVECHEKSYCDSRFSWISVFIHEYTKTNNIQSTGDLIRCISEKQQESNEFRRLKGEKEILSFQIRLELTHSFVMVVAFILAKRKEKKRK